MARSKKKKIKNAEKAKQEGQGDDVAVEGQGDTKLDGSTEDDAKETTQERNTDSYHAAAVVFFTRGKDGKVEKVLCAVEERKVQAKSLGLNQQGKIVQRVVVFPQGRKEKKDKNDPVETAKREYIEETTNYCNLSRYLDFADFGDADDEGASVKARGKDTWTGTGNMAVYFSPASMVVLFCEVKSEDAKQLAKSDKAPAHEEVAQPAKSDDKAEDAIEPLTKKQKLAAEQKKPSPSYRIGKMGHLQPTWIDADALRKAIGSGDRAPSIEVGSEAARFFPTNAAVMRLPEVRVLLGLPDRKSSAT